jgi:inner membrane protein
MNWFSEHFATTLIVLGFALLAAEVAVFGFSVFILFLVGLACVVTGALMAVGLFPATTVVAFGAVAFFSIVFAVTLWKPLKRMQNSGITHEVNGDFIGHSFVLSADVSATQQAAHRLSGVEWKVVANTAITAGTLVEVVKVDVGELTVKIK